MSGCTTEYAYIVLGLSFFDIFIIEWLQHWILKRDPLYQMLNENTGKFLREKRKNQVKEDNRERKREKREQIVFTEEQNKSKKEIVQEKEESLKSQTWEVRLAL